jgi:hypothetical protein
MLAMRSVVRRVFVPIISFTVIVGWGEDGKESKPQVIAEGKLDEAGAKLEHSPHKSVRNLASYF